MAKVSKYINAVRRILFDSSHLAPYVPIMAQSTQSRVIRLLSDKSNYSKHKAAADLENIIVKGPLAQLRVLYPTSDLALTWFFIVFCSIVYYYLEMGLVITYGAQVWEAELGNPVTIFFDILTILVMIIDIGVRFNCGFLHRGMIIMDRRRIFTKYLRGQFFLDIIAALILIIVPATGSFYLNYTKFWLLFKLLRLSEIDDSYMRRLYINRVLKTIYVVFKLIVIIFFLAHIVGLIFYALDFYLYTIEYYTPTSDFCWLVSSTALNNIIDLEWPLQYLYTLYWGVNTITTISYGDISPLNPIQNNYAMFAFCFGFMVYGYVVNQIVKIIMWARGHRDEFRQQMIIMETYMDKMKVTQQLRTKVRQYLYFIYTQQKNRDLDIEAQMKSKLPVQLHQALIRSAYSVLNSKLIEMFNSETATRFLFRLQQRNYTSGETVFSSGEKADNLYCLHKGFIRLEVYLSDSGLVISQCNVPNSIIGQYQFFRKDFYPFSCITNRASLMYILPFDALQQVMDKYSRLKQEYKLLLYQLQIKNNLERILYSCYFCSKFHDFRKCHTRLPQFNLSELQTEVRVQDPKRYPKKLFSTLRNSRIMKDFEQINKSTQKRLVSRIEKRLNKLKELISERDNDFETETVHDWEIFEPKWNLFEVKEQWNNRMEKQKQNKKNIRSLGLLSIPKFNKS